MRVKIMKRACTTALKPQAFEKNPHRPSGWPPCHLIRQSHGLLQGLDQKLHQLLAFVNLESPHEIVITGEEGGLWVCTPGGRLAQSDRLQGPRENLIGLLCIGQAVDSNRGRPESVKSGS